MLTCPNCHKKYPSPQLACPKCRQELVPLSAIKLRTDHPDLAQPRKRKSFSKGSRVRPDHRMETYVTAHTGSLQEMKEVARIMEREGIPSRITGHDGTNLPLRLEGGAIADPEGMAVQVPTAHIEKARAILDWEAQDHEKDRGMDRFTSNEIQESALCPGCESEVSMEDAACPKCGLDLDENDMNEEEYYCSSCGEPCNLEDPVCQNCGTHFDH